MKQFWTGVYGTYILKQNVSYLLKSLVIIMQKYTDNHCSYYTSHTIEGREQILIVRWMLHYLQFSQLSDLVLIYQQVFRKCQIIGCKNEMLTEIEQEKIYLFWLHFRRRKKEKRIRNTWLVKGKRISWQPWSPKSSSGSCGPWYRHQACLSVHSLYPRRQCPGSLHHRWRGGGGEPESPGQKEKTITICLCRYERMDSRMVLYDRADTVGIDTLESNADSLHI